MDMARPTRTPRAIATIVSPVVTRVVVPVLAVSAEARDDSPGVGGHEADEYRFSGRR